MRRAAGARRQSGEQGRVEAAAQEEAVRHVVVDLALDGGAQGRAELGERRRRDPALGRRGAAPAPVGAATRRFGIDADELAGSDLAEAAKRRRRRHEVAALEVAVERREVELARCRVQRQQGAELGSEADLVARCEVEERPLAGAIAGEEEAAPRRIPDGDREGAVESLDEPLTELVVERRQDIDVARAGDRRAARREPGAQLAVVVDLAVADHERPGRAAQRLLAAAPADRQPAGAERRAVVACEAGAVRPAMNEGGGDRCEALSADFGRGRRAVHQPADSAHLRCAAYRAPDRLADRPRRPGVGVRRTGGCAYCLAGG